MDFDKAPTTKISRVIWAVDPLASNVPLDTSTLREVEVWAKKNHIVIEPVCVFTPIGEIEKLASEKIVRSITELFLTFKVSVSPPFVLIRPLDSMKSSAQCLLSYAQETGTDLIVLSSHGRRGFPRMLFGSFAESVLNMSPIPLLFINKNPRQAGASFQNSLWATDFSKPCEFAFDAFLAQAKGVCKQITLFHDVSLPLEVRAYFAELDFGVPSTPDLLERQINWARQEADSWLHRARRQGFTVQSSVDSGRGEIANGILAAARENASGLIVMASQTGPVGSMLLGSHAREVFRASEFPVWIYGPQFSAAAKKKQRSQGAAGSEAQAR